MKRKNEANRLTGKDLMMVGIFTALYLVIYVLTSCILGVIPIISLTMTFFSSIILGIPMMLYFAKIKKFGMILITYTVNGILMIFLGLGVYSLGLGIICALIAELMIKSSNYKSSWKAILAFAIACVGANGNVIYWVYGSEEFLAQTAASMGQDYLNEVVGYFSIWWVLPAVLLSGFVGGLLGGMLGRKVLKKHFERSGLI